MTQTFTFMRNIFFTCWTKSFFLGLKFLKNSPENILGSKSRFQNVMVFWGLQHASAVLTHDNIQENHGWLVRYSETEKGWMEETIDRYLFFVSQDTINLWFEKSCTVFSAVGSNIDTTLVFFHIFFEIIMAGLMAVPASHQWNKLPLITPLSNCTGT